MRGFDNETTQNLYDLVRKAFRVIVFDDSRGRANNQWETVLSELAENRLIFHLKA